MTNLDRGYYIKSDILKQFSVSLIKIFMKLK